MVKLENTTAYTVDEAKDILHLCRDTVMKYIHNGELKARYIAGRYYTTDAAIEEFITGRTAKE